MSTTPTRFDGTIPAVTAAQMASIDVLMDDHYGVAPVQLMELAGMAVASFARTLLAAIPPSQRRVVVLAGTGGNGGDALVAARFLQGWGAAVTVILSRHPEEYHGLPAAHLDTVGQLGIPILAGTTVSDVPEADLIIDGLLGFSTTRPASGTIATLIELVNASEAVRLAIDVPSGLNATSGDVYDPCLRADVTLTLALAKTGLLVPDAAPWVGHLAVADIGVPPAAYAEIGVEVPVDLFAQQGIIPLSAGARR
jgi:NAD(P)H-hydrate epimerase